jgi:hypothetical protein
MTRFLPCRDSLWLSEIQGKLTKYALRLGDIEKKSAPPLTFAWCEKARHRRIHVCPTSEGFGLQRFGRCDAS